MYAENTNINVTRTSNTLNCFTDSNGDIQAQNYQGLQKVGVTVEKYTQLEKLLGETINKAEEYKNLLIEHKIITLPPSQEEQIANLTSIVSKQTEQMALLMKQLGVEKESEVQNELTS